MDIQFTEEQELLRSSIQKLLRDQYDFEARRKIVATEEGWSKKHWDAFAELGLLAAPFFRKRPVVSVAGRWRR